MIDQKFYRSLLPLVNDREQMDRLQSYCDERIETLRNHLENTKEIESIRHIQGSIAELRRFKTLRDEALQGAK
jgi:uncharacterized protein YbgA (DUF1722 family)